MRKDALDHGVCGEGQKEEGSHLAKKVLECNESEEQKTDENIGSDDKDLSAAMDSFDNLFCRRCLVRL